MSQRLNFQSENTTATTSLSGTLGQENRYSYNLSLQKQRENGNSLAFNHSYYAPLFRLNQSWSQSNYHHQRQLSLGISGAVVAHAKGITLSNDLTDTFAIVHAKGATGAPIASTNGNKIDYFGNGIVPYLSPYHLNYVAIDTNNLPDNVEFSATEQQVIPRANQAIFVEFATTVGRVVFFDIKGEQDAMPPLGTEVFNQNNELVGVVAQGGRIYSRGLASRGELVLSWHGKHCSIPYQLPDTSATDTPIILPAQCIFN